MFLLCLDHHVLFDETKQESEASCRQAAPVSAEEIRPTFSCFMEVVGVKTSGAELKADLRAAFIKCWINSE